MTPNIIGIDPSISSTGMCINGKLFNYSYEDNAYTKTKSLTKWYLDSEPYMNLRFHAKAIYGDYADEQIKKIVLHQSVVDKIVKDIKDNLIDGDINIGIEGYSYGSGNQSSLIDLVQFGTLLRSELLKITNNIHIISPSTLKLETCKLVYEPVIEKKKTVYRNNDGLAGGKFKKPDMLNAILEKDDWETRNGLDKYIKYLSTIEYGKNVPKPIEDVNDSLLIYFYLLYLHL